MKKIIFILSAVALLAGCYPDYVKDFDDGAGVYTAYQYDLRTFVIGENESFDFSVALGGVINNNSNIPVKVVVDNSLLTKDLTEFAPDSDYLPFTAIDAFLGSGSFGTVCQNYVTKEVSDAGIKAFQELPESYYTIKGLDGMTIKSGRHSASATVKATDFVKEDANMFAPCYALGFQIVSAGEADIIPERSFEIIAVKCENLLFGNWGFEGTTSVQDMSGNELYPISYDYSISDDKIYTLTTKSANSLYTNKIDASSGKLLLTLNDDNTIRVECADGSRVIEEIPGEPSYFNGAKKLEERVIYLNYKYASSGSMYVVHSILRFRDRTRDGVREYQGINE